jgi:pilus assembly protein CpaE
MQHFDLKLKHDLLEVLENADGLDAVALDAYMTQHASGLRLLAARPENTFEVSQDRSAALATLLDKLAEHYEQIVVDMPRRVDPYVATVLKRADRVVLVVQQTVGHLRDAVRMLQVLAHHGLKDEQVLVVVNRYEKDSPIGMEDVQRSMRDIEVINIPGDFKTVAESINLGVPIYEHARGSVVTKSLANLSTKLGGRAVATGGSRLGKAFSSLLRI